MSIYGQLSRENLRVLDIADAEQKKKNLSDKISIRAKRIIYTCISSRAFPEALRYNAVDIYIEGQQSVSAV